MDDITTIKRNYKGGNFAAVRTGLTLMKTPLTTPDDVVDIAQIQRGIRADWVVVFLLGITLVAIAILAMVYVF